MKIFLISGWKYSGKDTVAKHLIDSYGFKRFSFADTLKDMTAEQYGIERSWMDDPFLKEKPLENYPVIPKDSFSEIVTNHMKLEFRTIPGKEGLFWTPRALLILEGSTKRTANPNYWVDLVSELCIKSRSNCVVPDARYKNEIARMTHYFGEENVVSVRVERFDECLSQDSSERNLDDFTFQYKLNNRTSIEELRKQIDDMMSQFPRSGAQ